MKMTKVKKRFLMAFTALLIAGVTLTVALVHDSKDVEAVTAVFDGITAKYTSSRTQVKILEIVPASTPHSGRVENVDYTIDEASELGYFMTLGGGNNYANSLTGNDNSSPQEPITATRGGVHGVPLTLNSWGGISVNKTSDAFKNTMRNYYEYGIIKPAGPDGGYNTKLGEYPIYAHTAVFSQFNNGLFSESLGSRLVNGYYKPNTTGTGKYKIDDNFYRINEADQNKIYDVSVSRNSLGEVVSVSYNSIVAVDTTAMSLPKKTDGTPLITYDSTGTGNLDFVDVEGVAVPFQLYKGYSVAQNGNLGNVYYSISDQTKYHSSDWWNEYVLGDLSVYENAGLNTPYTVKAADQVTVDDITNADFIYISGTYEKYKNANVDLSAEVMKQIYTDEINYKHKAVMMDYALYNDALDNNISKLALLLWQKSQMATYRSTSEEHPKWFNKVNVTDGGKEYEVYVLDDSAWADTAFIDYLKENKIPAGTGNGNFVTGNTYVYNHHMSDFKSPKSMVDALDNFANGDFNTPYTDMVVASGLSAVSKYIETSNANAITKMVSNSISPAVCIQYILVSTGADLDAMKLTLNVLEIQPVPAFLYNTARGSREYSEFDKNNQKENQIIENRKEFVNEYLSSFYSDRIQFIKFTSMTVSEFNARSEDLVESYDIIYIGDETTRDGNNLYYTDNRDRNTYIWDESSHSYKLGKSRNLSVFNDTNMTGNLYYNVGDKVRVFGNSPGGDGNGYGGVSGWLDNEIYADGSLRTTRYPGRDITKNKLTKLEEFVEANALVLVAEELMGTPDVTTSQNIKNTRINPTIVQGNVDNNDNYGRIDNSSNLYEFLNYALGKEYTVSGNSGGYVNSASGEVHDNVVAVSDIKQGLVDRELLAEYVSTEKLILNLTDKPTPYSYTAQDNGVITTTTSLTTKDPDGTRYLEYKFSIDGAGEAVSEYGFSVALYVDINKDGKFSKTTENVQDIVIRTEGDGKEAPKDDANNYVLSPGVAYTLRRDISDDFSGLLNWKLDIRSNAPGFSHIHASDTGYTLVKDKDDPTKKKKIRILQITNNNSSLNMEPLLYDGRLRNSNNVWALLLNNVPDYELYIRTINVTDYERLVGQKYNEYKSNVEKSNQELPANQQIQIMSKAEYAANSYDTFFKDFVIQNVSIENCIETTLNNGQNSNLKSLGYDNEIGVDMVVCAFGDDYRGFTDRDAMDALQAFIKVGKPVLTSHDFIHFRTGISQNRVLRNLFGADLYGVSQDLLVEPDPITSKNKVTMLNAWSALTVRGNEGNTKFREAMTKGGKEYLHSGLAYTRSENADVLSVIEGSGKEVSYQPNSMCNMIAPETQGLSTMLIEWCRFNGDGRSWINAYASIGWGKGSWNNQHQPGLGPQYTVEQINEGQITNYPYRLKKSFTTTSTHSQYYTLDLTSDLDNDGESDVVVWYALGNSNNSNDRGQNPYSDTIGASVDPANGYYIYNDGNVTYTGAGHRDLTDCGLDEAELFINTLIAAYQTGVSNPSVGFYDSLDVNDKPITSVIVPYDGNVTDPKKGSGNKFDSSILKQNNSTEYRYKFVDPNTETGKGVTASDGTMIYYRVGDNNFVRGTKNIKARYYLQVANVIKDEENNKMYYKMPDGTKLDVVSLDVDGTTVSAVDISNRIYTYKTSGMKVEDTAMNRNKDGSLNGIESGRAYGFYLPMNLLNDNAGFTILVEAQTTITSVSTSGYGTNTTTEKAYQALSVVKADLLDLD